MNQSKLSEEVRRSCSYELAVLNEIAHVLNGSVDLSTLLTRTLEQVARLLKMDTGWVLLFDEFTGAPYTAASQNLPPGLQEDPERMNGWCFCLESLCTGEQPEASNVGIVKCSRLRQIDPGNGETRGLRFHASVPLRICGNGGGSKNYASPGDEVDTKARWLGMLNVATLEWRRLNDNELGFLYTIGDMLSVAIERARLHARQVEAAQSEERLRLAREIHDTIAQDFSAIAFQLEAAQAILERASDVERAKQSVATARELSQKGLVEARRSVMDLRAAPLEGRSLTEALGGLVSDLNIRNELQVTFEIRSQPPVLPAGLEIGLYRVAQEALQNALRHSRADSIQLMLDSSTECVTLTVEDDGQGFDMTQPPGREQSPGRRFGLIGMRERLNLLGGTLKIESTPGDGTRITARAPVTNGM